MKIIRFKMLIEIMLAALVSYLFITFPLIRIGESRVIFLPQFLPLIVISLRWGIIPCILAGLSSGILSALFTNASNSLAPLILDYIICLSIIGINFRRKIYGKCRTFDILIACGFAAGIKFFFLIVSGFLFPLFNNFTLATLLAIILPIIEIIGMDFIISFVILFFINGLSKGNLISYQL